MALPRSVIHLLTGERVRADRLESFLAASGLDVQRFHSALEAAASLSRQAESVNVTLMIVGVDWLPTDDAPLLGHIRRAWPAAEIVLYGAEAEWLRAETGPRVTILRGVVDVEQWIRARGDESARPACRSSEPTTKGNACPGPAASALAAQHDVPEEQRRRPPTSRIEGTISKNLRRETRPAPSRKPMPRVDRLTPQEMSELLGDPPPGRGAPH